MDNEIFGVDVSSNQGDIEWKRVFSDNGALTIQSEKIPIDFAWIRATMGTEKIDKKFYKNWEKIGNEINFRRKIWRGAYHFFYSDQSGNEQAKHFVETIKSTKNHEFFDTFALDAEYIASHVKYGDYAEKIEDFIKYFYENSKELTQKKLFLYSGLFFLKSNLLPYIKKSTLEKVNFWVARYTDEDPRTSKYAPKMENSKFWQFTDRSKVDGINSPVDCSISINEYENFKTLEFFEKIYEFFQLIFKALKQKKIFHGKKTEK